MSTKENAVSFLKLAASGNVQEAYARFVASNFIHHNQYFKGDRESLMRAMEEARKASPNKSIEVKQVFEDGNYVITHSLVTRANSEDMTIAVVHIFRFENDKVVELWDLGQPVQKDSPNENGII
jgi:predicted SnoaL-like aldol condensation-catalyzing enzyme